MKVHVYLLSYSQVRNALAAVQKALKVGCRQQNGSSAPNLATVFAVWQKRFINALKLKRSLAIFWYWQILHWATLYEVTINLIYIIIVHNYDKYQYKSNGTSRLHLALDCQRRDISLYSLSTDFVTFALASFPYLKTSWIIYCTKLA